MNMSDKHAAFRDILAKARRDTEINPSEAKIKAENYRKGVVKVRGLTIAIENPKGSVRRGTDKGGKKWEQKMAWDYGYAKGVDAVDGDQLDVFLGPDPEHGKIFVVNQVLDGKYDESKVMLGFPDKDAAEAGYLANYEKGWKGLGEIKELSDAAFKEWIRGGQTKAAASLQKSAQAKWRILGNLLAIARRLPSAAIADSSVVQMRHAMADALQGPNPNRMGQIFERFSSKLPAHPLPNTDGMLFRGINPVGEKVDDVLFGGGYYGGKVLHGSPYREIASRFGLNSGAGNTFNATGVYRPHRFQTYGRNFSVEDALEGRNPRLTNLPSLGTNSMETAITPRHNEPLGLLLGRGRSASHFVPYNDKSTMGKVRSLLGQLSERGESGTKYVSQGGLDESISDTAVNQLFKQAASEKQAMSFIGKGLGALGRNFKAVSEIPATLGRVARPVAEMAAPKIEQASQHFGWNQVPTRYVKPMQEVLEVNKRMYGPQGWGAVESLDDVTRRNPHMRYMASAEGWLPGVTPNPNGQGVIDYFHVGGSPVRGSREMAPMAMRQRVRIGTDAQGKAIYDKGAEQAMFQPMYRSSGMGSGASSEGRWVPFDRLYAPHNAGNFVDEVIQNTPEYSRYLQAAPHNPAASGENLWFGKRVRMSKGEGYVDEDLVHIDDIPAGYGNWAKEKLPDHLEYAQKILNNHFR